MNEGSMFIAAIIIAIPLACIAVGQLRLADASEKWNSVHANERTEVNANSALMEKLEEVIQVNSRIAAAQEEANVVRRDELAKEPRERLVVVDPTRTATDLLSK